MKMKQIQLIAFIVVSTVFCGQILASPCPTEENPFYLTFPAHLTILERYHVKNGEDLYPKGHLELKGISPKDVACYKNFGQEFKKNQEIEFIYSKSSLTAISIPSSCQKYFADWLTRVKTVVTHNLEVTIKLKLLNTLYKGGMSNLHRAFFQDKFITDLSSSELITGVSKLMDALEDSDIHFFHEEEYLDKDLYKDQIEEVLSLYKSIASPKCIKSDQRSWNQLCQYRTDCDDNEGGNTYLSETTIRAQNCATRLFSFLYNWDITCRCPDLKEHLEDAVRFVRRYFGNKDSFSGLKFPMVPPCFKAN